MTTEKMDYSEFCEFLRKKCMHEAIYDDSEGREILVIRTLDAWVLVNKIMGTYDTGRSL